VAWLYWDPNPVFVTIPIIGHPIMWYGVCFAVGFVFGYLLLMKIFSRYLGEKGKAVEVVDRLAWYIVFGTIIGARLGDVFFYDWDICKENLMDIFKIWHGGLASHGGAVGVIIALFIAWWSLKAKVRNLPFLVLLDFVVIPTALVAAFIRVGNFFNQEILGTVTSVPWAVVFGHPLDGSPALPRHPVQLYESLAYFVLFAVLAVLWRCKADALRRGFISGIFFSFAFSLRFCLEFFKMPQSSLVPYNSSLLMGQYLSIPFIVAGIVLLIYSTRSKRVFVGEHSHGDC